MGAGAYRVIEGVIDFAIAIIDTLGSLFDSQEGTTSAEAQKILESLKAVGRGFIEMLPVGFVFSLCINYDTHLNIAKNCAENGNLEGTFNYINSNLPNLGHENLSFVIYKLIGEDKPIPAAQLYIKHFEMRTKNLKENLYELSAGNTMEATWHSQSQGTINTLINMLTNTGQIDTEDEKSKKLGLAKQLLEILTKGNPIEETKKRVREYANAKPS